VCCDVFRCVAEGWQCVAVCYSVLQCLAVCCGVLHIDNDVLRSHLDEISTAGVLQCVAMCCSVLAVCCSVLQCVAYRY